MTSRTSMPSWSTATESWTRDMYDVDIEDTINDESRQGPAKSIEFVGERVKRPFADVTSRFKDVDWHEICKIHDFMTHQYEEVDSEFQWSTVKNDSRPSGSTVRRLWRHSNRNPMVDDSPVTESYPVPNINIRFRPMQLFAACLVHRSETSSSDSNPLSLV